MEASAEQTIASHISCVLVVDYCCSELVEVMKSAVEEEGKDFAQPKLMLDNLDEGFRIVTNYCLQP